MTEKTPPVEGNWVMEAAPAACTLPTVDRPLRAAEWDDLFATATRAVHRIDAVRARWELQPDPGVAAHAGDLTVRETRCCSFFTFALTATDGQLNLDVSTPAEQIDVLDAMVDWARSRIGAGSR